MQHALQRQRQQPHHRFPHAKRARTVAAANAATANAAPSSSSSSSPVVWTQTSNGSWVASPRYASSSSSARRPPPGVVHLLGGAFAGAAPQVAYAKLAEALASPPRRRSNGGNSSNSGGGGGFTVVTTPYRLTFDHLRSAERVRRDLKDAVEEVASSSSPSSFPSSAQSACAAVLDGRAPLLALGHSNGALLHALGACQQQEQSDDNLLTPKAVVLVSYNNKSVGDAVPFGLLDRLRDALPPPTADDADANKTPSLPPLPVPAGELAEALLPPRIARASPAVEQVATVADEVRRGASDFDPPPEQTRALVSRLFPTNLRTLLVRFSDDNTDETPELSKMLADRPEVATIVLPGNHLTPCGADESLLRDAPPVAVAAGMARPASVRPFTPADALAMAAREWGRAARERDADRLADRIVAFLRAAAA